MSSRSTRMLERVMEGFLSAQHLMPIDPRALSRSAKPGNILANMGFVPLITGAEVEPHRGYNAAGDLVGTTADGYDLNALWTEFQAAVQAMNDERQPIIDLLTFPVVNPIERVPQISSADFEPASEYGEPVGQRPKATLFTLGYDFGWYDLATRFTWLFLADSPASQVEATAAMALEADNRLVFAKVMDALYQPVNRLADINGQEVNVYSLYNADGTIPPSYKTNTFTGAHTHYLTSGAATIDSADVDQMYEHVRHHGYSFENGVQHLLLLNSREGRVARTWRVLLGDQYDFIPASGQPGQFLNTGWQLFGGTQPGNTFRGMNIIGSYGNILICEDDTFPPGYATLLASGGKANLNNPVGLREHANTTLRGLRLVKGANPDYPLIDSFYQRGFGTGIRQRGGAVVMQITANAAYTAPTF